MKLVVDGVGNNADSVGKIADGVGNAADAVGNQFHWIETLKRSLANPQGILYFIHPNDGKIEGKHRSET